MLTVLLVLLKQLAALCCYGTWERRLFRDVDGNKYIDYLATYDPIITGHAHPHITKAITTVAENGVLYGTPTALEVKFAKMLKEAMPALDKVRFVNSVQKQ